MTTKKYVARMKVSRNVIASQGIYITVGV
jgi:hypothetical protein